MMKKYDDHFESEYNLRARHPDFETYFERWQSESEHARSTLPCNLDQQYGDGSNMSLDIFPQPGASHPILLFIHGGYWRSMDKELFAYPAIGLNKSGVVYISINYALAPTITLDEIVEQCRQAVTWVHRNAETFGGDPNRIHISGHSAGGHLTAMMLSTDWAQSGVVYISINYALAPTITLDEIVEQCRQAVTWVHRNAETFGGDPNRIHISGHSAGGHLTAMMLSTDWAQRGEAAIKLAGGIAISGLFDLAPILETSINDEVQLDMISARRNSPSEFLPSNGIAAVGANETDEFLRQSREYASAWKKHSGDGQYLPLAGFHHFDVVCELGRAGSELNDAVLVQIGA